MDKKQLDGSAEKRQGGQEPEPLPAEKSGEGQQVKGEEPRWIDTVELVEFDLL